ncbi:T9SS type A sorting domain-containing protein [candidate division WOR-3 bacterium]|nr:T9SS type A sorting domain-containing protein [candidate division WOR-3 bacterium]
MKTSRIALAGLVIALMTAAPASAPAANPMPYDHDVAAYEIITPESVVETGVDIEPRASVCNLGEEAEVINVILVIYDYDPDTVVYHTIESVIHLPAEDDPHELTFSTWTPGDPGRHYVAELLVFCNGDQNPANDTLIKHVWSSAAIAEVPTTEGFELEVREQTVCFSAPYSTRAELTIYDVNGRKVRELTDRTYTTGTHTLTWDGCDDKGHKVTQGVYLVRMEADSFEVTRKVILY